MARPREQFDATAKPIEINSAINFIVENFRGVFYTDR